MVGWWDMHVDLVVIELFEVVAKGISSLVVGWWDTHVDLVVTELFEVVTKLEVQLCKL